MHYQKKSMKKIFIFMLISVSFLFFGCNALENVSDDSSFDAKKERGLTALNEGNYEKAAEIFKNLKNNNPGDNSIKSYYASALSGSAGLDVYNLLETLDKIDKNSSDGDSTIELVGGTLSGNSGQSAPEFTEEEINKKIEWLEQAMAALIEITGNEYSSFINQKKLLAVEEEDLNEKLNKLKEGIKKLSDDERIQLGLIAINHSILVISKIIMGNTGQDKIKFNKESFYIILQEIVPEKILDKLSIDIQLIGYAIDAIEDFLDSDNDIREEFDKFLNRIDENSDGYISESELQNYLQNL
ncbi:MAG: hypothetical protein CSB21_03640 [Deltaproteobacteria bacterium]|nr:MAG: hypothetical protein CSB21_03640 [Deltaproteobacteria bacterium]